MGWDIGAGGHPKQQSARKLIWNEICFGGVWAAKPPTRMKSARVSARFDSSIFLSIFLSIYLSIYLCIDLSIIYQADVLIYISVLVGVLVSLLRRLLLMYIFFGYILTFLQMYFVRH